MARVDPFLSPLPKKIIQDPELRPFYEFLLRFLHDIWLRTGGGVDLVEDLEASQTTENGGNRSTRFQRDEIDKLWAHITELKKPVDLRPEIQALSDQLSQLKRSISTVEQEIYTLKEDISKTTRSTRHYGQTVIELEDLIIQQKKVSKTTEQKVNELTERYDSGT